MTDAKFVMPGLVPGIHVFGRAAPKTWMAGTAMTEQLERGGNP
jgi:hypothetical protein